MDVSGQYRILASLSPETKFRYHCRGANLDILQKRELFRPARIRTLDSLVRSLVTVIYYAIPAVLLLLLLLLLLHYLSFII
jgi:hypothetical protein